MSARKGYPYPQDEFDVAGSAGGPEGVHRAERSTAHKVVPWIVVLLLVPLISFGIVYWISQTDSDVGGDFFGDDEPSPTAPADEESPEDGEGEEDSESGANDEDGAADGEDEDGEEPDETEEPPPPVDREAPVEVLNATQISGLAALGAERVQADGFSTVTAENYRGGGERAESVVKYTDPDLEPTAEKIAEILGISDVSEGPEAEDGIVVELWEGLD